MGVDETAIAVLQEKVKSLEMQLCTVQGDIKDKFDRLEAKLDLALKAIQSGRPTWGVAGALAGLMTICTGLIVYLATH